MGIQALGAKHHVAPLHAAVTFIVPRNGGAAPRGHESLQPLIEKFYMEKKGWQQQDPSEADQDSSEADRRPRNERQ